MAQSDDERGRSAAEPGDGASGSETGWRRVETIFFRVLEAGPEARERVLDEACGADDELRRDVASLLEAGAASTDRFVGRLAGAIGETAAQAAAADAPARRIGHYRLLREIGHGGMGVVYLAERADGAYEQRVAIKLVKRHVTDDEARRRFLAERQILARLDHPAIARLLDGGTTDEGTPYLVMEWVDGERIDRWCQRQGLDVDARLRLFLEVCDAVEAAHRQLVVHRDLKPSNILVTGDGRPHLLDFGVAKLLDDDAARTETIERRLTPSFASPEQVLGGTITTATDVYSLGVLLYQLLTGRLAVEVAGRTPAQVLDAVCHAVPPRPSVAVSRPPAGEGEDRGAATKGRARRLRGELDAIAMTALRKEPERRYSSVSRLAEDVRRHLAGKPVTAHSERWAYLAGKWLRRHAAAAAAATTVVLALAGGLVARTVEARRANRAAATSERVSGFLVSLLSEADPERNLGREPTVVEAVRRGAEKVERELADDPLIQAQLLHVIGQVLKQRGDYEPALDHLERALALRERHGAADAEVAATLEALGDIGLKQNRFEPAEIVLRRALALRQAARPADPAALSDCQTLLGIVLTEIGRLDEGEALFGRAHDLRRRLYGEAHEQIAKSLNNLAWAKRYRGDLDGAIPLYRQSLDMKRRVLPPEHPSLATALQNLAVVLAARGAHDEAHTLRLEAVEIARGVYGDRHPRYANMLAELGSQLHDLRRFDGAEAAYLGALEVQDAAYPNGHIELARTINNLASLYEDRGEPATAEPLFVRSLAMRRELFGEDHAAVARARFNLARVRVRLGRQDESETLYRQALATWRQVRPEGHADIGKTARRLGELLLASGRAAEAEPLLEEAVAVFAGHARDHPERAAAEAALVAAGAGRSVPGSSG